MYKSPLQIDLSAVGEDSRERLEMAQAEFTTSVITLVENKPKALMEPNDEENRNEQTDSVTVATARDTAIGGAPMVERSVGGMTLFSIDPSMSKPPPVQAQVSQMPQDQHSAAEAPQASGKTRKPRQPRAKKPAPEKPRKRPAAKPPPAKKPRTKAVPLESSSGASEDDDDVASLFGEGDEEDDAEIPPAELAAPEIPPAESAAPEIPPEVCLLLPVCTSLLPSAHSHPTAALVFSLTFVCSSQMAKVVAAAESNDASIWLRLLACEDAPLNGAQVDVGETVEVLDRTDTQGTTWVWVKAGRKKGWVRSEYVVSSLV